MKGLEEQRVTLNVPRGRRKGATRKHHALVVGVHHVPAVGRFIRSKQGFWAKICGHRIRNGISWVQVACLATTSAETASNVAPATASASATTTTTTLTTTTAVAASTAVPLASAAAMASTEAAATATLSPPVTNTVTGSTAVPLASAAAMASTEAATATLSPPVSDLYYAL